MKGLKLVTLVTISLLTSLTYIVLTGFANVGLDLNQQAIKVKAKIIYSCFSKVDDCDDLLAKLIRKAKVNIRVMVMLITADTLADELIRAHNRGVNIKIIIDDNWVNRTGSDFWKLKMAGIEIRHDGKSSLMHHKVMIIDGKIVVTGSYNWSKSAEDRNDENIVVIKNKKVAKIYLREFNRIWSNAKP